MWRNFDIFICKILPFFEILLDAIIARIHVFALILCDYWSRNFLFLNKIRAWTKYLRTTERTWSLLPWYLGSFEKWDINSQLYCISYSSFFRVSYSLSLTFEFYDAVIRLSRRWRWSGLRSYTVGIRHLMNSAMPTSRLWLSSTWNFFLSF